MGKWNQGSVERIVAALLAAHPNLKVCHLYFPTSHFEAFFPTVIVTTTEMIILLGRSISGYFQVVYYLHTLGSYVTCCLHSSPRASLSGAHDVLFVLLTPFDKLAAGSPTTGKLRKCSGKVLRTIR